MCKILQGMSPHILTGDIPNFYRVIKKWDCGDCFSREWLSFLRDVDQKMMCDIIYLVVLKRYDE